MKRFLEKRRNHLEDESGSVLILVAGMLVVMLVVTAFAIDFGQVYVVNSKVQTACDVSAMAAVSKYDPTKTGCDKTNNLAEVRKEAKRVMKVNGYTIDDSDVIINEVNQTVEVKKAVSVDTTFAKIINVNKLNTSKSAVAAKQKVDKPGLTLEYALFSGSTTMPIAVNGALHVAEGNVHTNFRVEMSEDSSLDIGGKLTSKEAAINAEQAHQFDIDGKKEHKATVVSETIPMPDYDSAIMARLPKENEYQNKVWGSLDEYCNQNGYTIIGNVKVKRVYYCSQPITIAANSSLQIVGDENAEQTDAFGQLVTIMDGGSIWSRKGGIHFDGGTYLHAGYIVAEKNITFGGNGGAWGVVGMNNFATSVIYSKQSNIEFCAAVSTVYGLVYAPKGEMLLQNNYSVSVSGSLVANQVNTSRGSLSIYKSQASDTIVAPVTGKIPDPNGTDTVSVGKTKLVK
jgi:Flp pilus assembly protein TadG